MSTTASPVVPTIMTRVASAARHVSVMASWRVVANDHRVATGCVVTMCIDASAPHDAITLAVVIALGAIAVSVEGVGQGIVAGEGSEDCEKVVAVVDGVSSPIQPVVRALGVSQGLPANASIVSRGVRSNVSNVSHGVRSSVSIKLAIVPIDLLQLIRETVCALRVRISCNHHCHCNHQAAADQRAQGHPVEPDSSILSFRRMH